MPPLLVILNDQKVLFVHVVKILVLSLSLADWLVFRLLKLGL
jgi:hypothetical protein